MDKLTRLKALHALARSAAEIAADIASTLSDAAACPETADNQIRGTVMHAEPQVEALQKIFAAIDVIHKTRTE